MKNIWFWCFCCCWPLGLLAQEDAWVYLVDKPQAATFLNQPELMLSPRALSRRARCQIALDIHDVPLESTYVQAVQNWPNVQVLAQSKWLNALHVRAPLGDLQNLGLQTFVGQIRFANHNLSPILKPPAVAHGAHRNPILRNNPLSYGASASVMNQLGASCLHQGGFTGQGMLIAVLDNGFTGVPSHPAFAAFMANNQCIDAYDFVHRDANVFDSGSHGTMVLSALAAKADGQLIGTAFNAQYALFITEDTASEQPLEESLWVEAAERADSLGVDVINTSLGYKNFDNSAYDHPYSELDGQTTFIARGLEMAWSRGILCVVAAGNFGQSNPPSLSTPADAPHALTVGAVDGQGNLATFSSTGPNAAGMMKPELVAPGVNITVANSTGGYSVVNGTSLSTPEMAGLASCLWQSQLSLTHIQVRELLLASGSLYPQSDAQMGYGIPNFCTAYNLSTVGHTEENFKVWPSPTHQWWQVQVPTAAVGQQYGIYNTLGQCVLTGQAWARNFSIDGSMLAPGVYLMVWAYPRGQRLTLIKQ